MGLDISAYSNLRAVGNPITNKEDLEDAWDNGSLLFYKNPHFQSQFDSLLEKQIYEFDEEIGFRAGSYGGYNQWRHQLNKLRGDNEKAFEELINFSDCEGAIGPVTSAKLVVDFLLYKNQAEQQDSYFLNVYNDFLAAFQMASNNGAVSFH